MADLRESHRKRGIGGEIELRVSFALFTCQCNFFSLLYIDASIPNT